MLLGGYLKLVNQSRVRLRQLNFRCVGPETVEVIELAHRLIENMHDDIGEVHQHPVAPG